MQEEEEVVEEVAAVAAEAAEAVAVEALLQGAHLQQNRQLQAPRHHPHPTTISVTLTIPMFICLRRLTMMKLGASLLLASLPR